ncbi:MULTISPECIES: DUF1656 domain-containing protein [Sphingomonas]|jgi:hypothetical protein|uniref:DUF1656 domain-containing protein n=1 Tax=Sphingomonas TaxID=13687 RepID=UPI0006F8F4DF|nr:MULTISPECIES: DUF1656 domain-containing protein [unclassified Sphingomonas]KQO06788.1 hypothetical protein ASF09_10945 [Sphingomonas sp. Leaf242]KQS49586.1 hypothetical protein ASG20_11425 [Sphingomonas sp. Leaf198]RMB36745.1 uncharacterized protein DUF1656 [Sphingomonas sp. PP-F2F-G114-C0414]RMB54535.1 uncharacterized protein DUF1656 [Sphingomonas sp. PP-CE-3A-406]TCP71026.1 uncharacterized protein DUF1656 [Sphingomonas sp. PP-CE-1G-424]
MTGEISIGGVFLPSILLLAVAAVLLTGLATRLLAFAGFYRVVTYRPLVDLALFILILGLLALLTGPSA